MEGSMINLDAVAAYGLISDDLVRVGCDNVARGNLSNGIVEHSTSSSRVSCDLLMIMWPVVI